MLYVTIRHKSNECMGVFSEYKPAANTIERAIEERGSSIEHIHTSEGEGWQQIESQDGEIYTIQICELDKPVEAPI